MEDSGVAVLLEDLKVQLRGFGEGLQTVMRKLDRLDQRFDGIEQRFEGCDHHSEGLGQMLDRIERKLDAHFEEDRRQHALMMRSHSIIRSRPS